jgi:hypothetical protein
LFYKTRAIGPVGGRTAGAAFPKSFIAIGPARTLCVRGRYDKNVDPPSALRQSCRVRALRMPRSKSVAAVASRPDALNGTNMLICRIGPTISSAVFAPVVEAAAESFESCEPAGFIFRNA